VKFRSKTQVNSCAVPRCGSCAHRAFYEGSTEVNKGNMDNKNMDTHIKQHCLKPENRVTLCEALVASCFGVVALSPGVCASLAFGCC